MSINIFILTPLLRSCENLNSTSLVPRLCLETHIPRLRLAPTLKKTLHSLAPRLCLVTHIRRLRLAPTHQQTLARPNGKKQIQSNIFRQPTALCHFYNYQLDSCILSSRNSTNSLRFLKFYATGEAFSLTRLRPDGKSLALNRNFF